ncbi:hypothetical protein CPB85DRAFT_1436598 [Mucidula mucida]|nr:hypothetical protein CPB85DRAFT_1436598 [Mucidula mucida]
MPASATSALSRCVAWFLGKCSRSSSEGLVEKTEELRIPAPTRLQDDSHKPQAFKSGAALFTLPQHLPLALLELSLLCTAQGVAAVLEEPQTIVLRTAVAALKVTVTEFVEPTPMEVEILRPTPTICLTPPTPTKRKPKADSKSFAPLQNIASAPGTLRPSGKWHGRKHTSSRRAHGKENLASRPLKTREERLKAYTPPARFLVYVKGKKYSQYPTSHRF